MGASPVFAIIGASTAGAFAARSLREDGFEGRILLIGAEKEFPYARPPLTKQYLEGDYERKRLFLWPGDSYDELGIEMFLGMRASRILPAERSVELEDGRRLPADRILIATGMSPRRLPLSGASFPNVHYLRTLADCDAILDSCKGGGSAVLIGGGFIGMEVAASLRGRDIEVSVVHRGEVVLEKVLGVEAARILMDMHRGQGVVFHSRTNISAIEGEARANRVILESGKAIDCDVVIVGVGAVPALDVTEGIGLQVERGILVDEFCRTNVDNVFAAGDVTEFYHPSLGRRMHIEHWDNARLHGIAAARNMLGKRFSYRPVPFFWSDQFAGIQYAGFPVKWERTVFRGNVEEEEFAVFMLDGRRLVSAVCFNRWKDRRACERLLGEGIEIDPDKLADETFDLESVSAA